MLLDRFYRNWRPVEQEERHHSYPTIASVCRDFSTY
jgi:hypothetical protein